MITGLKPYLSACLGLILSMIQSAGSLAGKPVKLDDRMRIFNALNEQNLLNEYRMLAHLVHLCNLVIDDESYPVIDVILF